MNSRQSIRYPSAIRIQLLSANHPLIEAQVLNLSRGGTLLSLSQEDIDLLVPDQGQTLTIKLFLPTGPANGQALIAWALSNKQQLGLRFCGWAEPGDHKNLEAFVANGFI